MAFTQHSETSQTTSGHPFVANVKQHPGVRIVHSFRQLGSSQVAFEHPELYLFVSQKLSDLLLNILIRYL
jgi:hypothetical protein